MLLSLTLARYLAHLSSETSFCYHAESGRFFTDKAADFGWILVRSGLEIYALRLQRNPHCASFSGARVLLSDPPAQSSGYSGGQMSCFNPEDMKPENPIGSGLRDAAGQDFTDVDCMERAICALRIQKEISPWHILEAACAFV